MHRGAFVWRGPYEERTVPRNAGFRFHHAWKVWYTPSPLVAARLRAIADQKANSEIQRRLILVEPWPGQLLFPKDETPKPHQTDAALFALSRNRSYLALDPGLGKTIVAALIANALAHRYEFHNRIHGDLHAPRAGLFVYVCPPFLLDNTLAEWERWCTFPLAPRLWGREPGDTIGDKNFLLVPDSRIGRDGDRLEIQKAVRRIRESGHEVTLFVDEAHRFANADTQRSKGLFGFEELTTKKNPARVPGLADCANRVVYMSGTPLSNDRPMELFPLLEHSAHDQIDFLNRFDYGLKFCDGHETDFGWDFNGVSNLNTLKQKLRKNFMLRMRKKLLKLPPKTEEMIVMGDTRSPRLASLDRDLLEKYSPDDILAELMRKKAIAEGTIEEGEALHLSTYRRLLGQEKVEPAAEILKNFLRETHEAFMVGAIHTDVVYRLAELLEEFKPLVITGKVPPPDRIKVVNEFQNSKARRLIIGNVFAMGVGFTLTKATRVAMVEWPWTPGAVDQFIDRTHRIGQESPVHTQYFVFKNSVDKAVLGTVLRKRETTNEI